MSIAAGLGAHQPDRRLPLAQQRQGRCGEVQAATAAAKVLTYFKFRFLRRPRWEALLREGHHRIKNSLQGLAALLHRHAGSAGEQAAVLTEAVGQVRAIAAVHDLYSRQGQPPVTLAELLDTLVKSVDGLYPEHSPIERIPASGIDNTAIPSSEVVPLAIIVNELLTNAAKHGSPGTSPQDMIRVHTRADENGISLRIDNPGSLPAGFDFDDRQGLGNGLQLMAALLNPPHTDLSLRQVTPQTVSATLHLARPPIRPQHNLSHVP
ncbi:sensor histidine kinase [Zoogloea oleivorans]|uniref:histidine kinase n=1 Tax=Zoogloea oleivorans TaxID=1552750 RepID=A0A6C2D2F9_9RHOO|nr:sensor histidine kinase [Zoogloea oleivorans]